MRWVCSILAERLGSARRRARFQARRLRADKRGVTSIEFAIVSVPVIGLVFAIAETGLSLFSQHALDNAVMDASRQIMTGEAQNGGFNANQFKTNLCSRITGLIDCANGVYIDVRSYSSPAPPPLKPVKNGAFDPSDFGYSPGGPNCIIVVRAAVKYRGYTPLLGTPAPELSDGNRVLMSTTSFRNEPYVNSSGIPACG
ncbi:MAG: hypothetical protein BGP06_01040 [Rhizobiales bacterium 65-9]|nr:pilus assembly protein [Hyphomicrobiales bacterium]OJY37337.1 MAG: hypothetical protein BGP06_01040 [Rhizobiales bacterium 65-9]